MPTPMIPAATLLPERAFVVQFTLAADLDHGRIEGRVEHVVSGRSERFDSLAVLMAFLARILAAEPEDPA